MHDVGGVFTIGPFFCTDGEADTPPGGLTRVAAVGDGACVEGIHDALYAFLEVMFACVVLL